MQVDDDVFDSDDGGSLTARVMKFPIEFFLSSMQNSPSARLLSDGTYPEDVSGA